MARARWEQIRGSISRSHGKRGIATASRRSTGSVAELALLLVGACLPGLCGCGRATGGPPAASGRPRAVLPVVITPPRPFRTAMLATPPAGRPATAAATAAPSSAAGALAEPRRFPGPPTAPHPAAAKIGTMLRDYTAAFNRHDAVALAAHWSPTAENVDLDNGDVTRGREAVKEVFSSLFRADGSGQLGIDIESIRMLRDDVAVVDAVSAVSFVAADRAAPAAPSRRRLSAVVVRHDDQWLLESVRESQLPGVPAVEQQPLEALAWMVGTWEGTVAGATVRTDCQWAAGRRFLVRQHVMAATIDTSPPTSGDRGIPGLLLPGSAGSREVSEVIAFDSDRGQIRSWFFNSQGRFAEGTWAREADRFVVLVEGRGSDSGTTSRCRIERIGPAECMTTCAGDALLDLCPPACGAVRLD